MHGKVGKCMIAIHYLRRSEAMIKLTVKELLALEYNKVHILIPSTTGASKLEVYSSDNELLLKDHQK